MATTAFEKSPAIQQAGESSRLFRLQHRYAPYLFVAPFVLVFSVFGLYPIVKSLLLSLYATNGPRNHVFVGLSNFRFLLSDNDFRTSTLR